MTKVTVSEDIKGKAVDVWKISSDFGGLKVGGPITSFEVTGKGVGMVRTIGMGGAKVVERLDRLPGVLSLGDVARGFRGTDDQTLCVSHGRDRQRDIN